MSTTTTNSITNNRTCICDSEGRARRCSCNGQKCKNTSCSHKTSGSPYRNQSDYKCQNYKADQTPPRCREYGSSQTYTCSQYRDYGTTSDRSVHGDIKSDILGFSQTYMTYTGNPNENPENVDGKFIVTHTNINEIINNIKKEVEERKKCSWYLRTSCTDTNVQSKQYIDHTQPLERIQTSIKELIDQITVNKDSKISPYSRIDEEIATGDLVAAGNGIDDTQATGKKLWALAREVRHLNQECICYADCLGYQEYYRRQCTCNINCSCNYS